MTWLTQITMGSLFDGIGGFPLAAVRNGITPVWASEIEAFPIEVTKLRSAAAQAPAALPAKGVPECPQHGHSGDIAMDG